MSAEESAPLRPFPFDAVAVATDFVRSRHSEEDLPYIPISMLNAMASILPVDLTSPRLVLMTDLLPLEVFNNNSRGRNELRAGDVQDADGNHYVRMECVEFRFFKMMTTQTFEEGVFMADPHAMAVAALVACGQTHGVRAAATLSLEATSLVVPWPEYMHNISPGNGLKVRNRFQTPHGVQVTDSNITR